MHTHIIVIKCYRHSDGALTGLSKKMIRQLYGEAQFKRWRRSYDERPPPISSFSAACEFMLLSA
jgi:bisphosphoglycerate-dependent phosphoglycerate mutase